MSNVIKATQFLVLMAGEISGTRKAAEAFPRPSPKNGPIKGSLAANINGTPKPQRIGAFEKQT